MKPGDLCTTRGGRLSLHREPKWNDPDSPTDINDGNPLVGMMDRFDIGLIIAQTHRNFNDWSLVLCGFALGWRETSWLREAT